jgi:nucleoside-diphosphate-sugar epimerase
MDDLISALLALMATEDIRMEVFNLGTGTAYSIQQIVDTCEELLGQKIIVDVDPERLRKVDAPLLQNKIGKLQNATGWQPKYDFRSGMQVVLRSEGLIE